MNNVYLCCDGSNIFGYGATVDEAYKDYQDCTESQDDLGDLSFYKATPIEIELREIVKTTLVSKEK